MTVPHAALHELSPYRASKWVKLPLLLSLEELEDLLKILPEWIAPLSGVISESEQLLTKPTFLTVYGDYLKQIKTDARLAVDRRLNCAFTNDLNDLRAIPISGGLLMRIIHPVLQVQPYKLHYSETAGKFHEMTNSRDSFNWGLLFTAPQWFQNPFTEDAEKVTEQTFPAMATFRLLQRWARNSTVPTPFQIGDKVINHPARIGKQLIEDLSLWSPFSPK